MFNHLVLAAALIVLVCSQSVAENLMETEASDYIKPELKAITLVEVANTVVHTEFIIDADKHRADFLIGGLPRAVIDDSINIRSLSGEEGLEVIEQILMPPEDRFSPYQIKHEPMPDNSVKNNTNASFASLKIKFAKPISGKYRFLMNYQLASLTWQLNTELYLKSDNTKADLSSWVLIHNNSELDFEKVELALFESISPNILGKIQDYNRLGRDISMAAYLNKAAPAWVKVYSHKLSVPISIPPRGHSKALLYRYSGLPVLSHIIYDGVVRDQRYFKQNDRDKRSQAQFNQRSHQEVWQAIQVLIKDSKLMSNPIPAGKLNIYDADSAVIGSQSFGRIVPGKNFEVMMSILQTLLAQRQQLKYEIIERDKIAEETVQIELKNLSDSNVDLTVREHLDRGERFELLGSSHDPAIEGSILLFSLSIKPGQAESIVYTVRYHW